MRSTGPKAQELPLYKTNEYRRQLQDCRGTAFNCRSKWRDCRSKYQFCRCKGEAFAFVWLPQIAVA
jgi:hypothetical protein